MTKCICIVCKREKEHVARGMCKNCYSKKWLKEWRKENPEHAKNMDGKVFKRETCKIIKEHDIRHKDDSESLDIRKFLDVEC